MTSGSPRRRWRREAWTMSEVDYHGLVIRFPPPGPAVALAYRELHLMINGTPEQKAALGKASAAEMPRPWVPESCHDELREDLWEWFERVATWLNHEYSWDRAPLIPSCWPLHPHIVHELAVLADQRYKASVAYTSDPLEDWHRYTLPAFIDRMLGRLKEHCSDGHKQWPSHGKHKRSINDDAVAFREDAYVADLTADTISNLRSPNDGKPRGARNVALVNMDTGQVLETELPDQEP